MGKLKIFSILLLLLSFLSNFSLANDLQLKIGDSVSIYSNKAYRSDGGKKFEAVGNVVIISGSETLYGDSAIIDLHKKFFKIEGNIRLISKDITIYGSKIQYFMDSPNMTIEDSRIVTKSFTIVAAKLDRKAFNKYIAIEAEYTTCKDCPESWSLFGKEFIIELGEYITIRNALIRANGINVTWIPYIVLPAKSERQTGLLFPSVTNRVSEGVSVGVPWFWAIGPNKDLTLTPTFWSNRGQGTDIEYRHVFTENSSIQLNSRLLNDEIYNPITVEDIDTKEDIFRNFTTFEAHFERGFHFNSHVRMLGLKDLDMISSFPGYTADYVRKTALGFDGFAEYRDNNYLLGVESTFYKNTLFGDSLGFDHSYVQTLPKFNFSYLPRTVVRSSIPGLKRVSVGIDANHTTFKQNRMDETELVRRNVNRLKIRPYLDWNMFDVKNIYFKSYIYGDHYSYRFIDSEAEEFRKFSLLTETSASIQMERIFGLSYQYKLLSDKLKFDEQKVISSKESQYVGELPSLDEAYKNKLVAINKNSYKHSLELKLIHHQIHNDGSSGNQLFRQQIETKIENWFDYEDSFKSEEAVLGGTQSRQLIPKYNTLEFQWNNVLVRKTPKQFNYLIDDKYLSDNFIYKKIGHFNISQGVIVDAAPSNNSDDNLTRLKIDTSYLFDNWEFSLTEYYFHDTSDNIGSLGIARDLKLFKLFFNYNLNTFDLAPLRTVSYGFFHRPMDIFAFTYKQEIDINAEQTLNTVYGVDYIPLNNCWRFGLTYSKTLVGDRISFDLLFNYGDENFGDSGASYKSL